MDAKSKIQNVSKEKILIKSYFKKLEEDCNDLESVFSGRLQDKSQLINFKEELRCKWLEADYIFNKKLQSLKRFALQESFYRAEKKILIEEFEQNCSNIIYDSILKLTKQQIIGFESPEFLKSKFVNKFLEKYEVTASTPSSLWPQQKVGSKDEDYKKLMKIFEESEEYIIQEQDKVQARKSIQLKVLKNYCAKCICPIDKKLETNLMSLHKSDFRKYEKMIDLKSNQINNEDREAAKNKQQSNLPQSIKDPLLKAYSNDLPHYIKQKSSSSRYCEEPINKSGFGAEKFDFDIDKDRIAEFKQRKLLEYSATNKAKTGEAENQDIKMLEISQIPNTPSEFFDSSILKDLAFNLKANGELNDIENYALNLVVKSIKYVEDNKQVSTGSESQIDDNSLKIQVLKFIDDISKNQKN